MRRFKFREFIVPEGRGEYRATLDPKSVGIAKGQANLDSLRAEMDEAAFRLAQALQMEAQWNRASRRKNKHAAEDLERFRQGRQTVEECAEIYVSSVRQWRRAVQAELPADAQSAGGSREGQVARRDKRQAVSLWKYSLNFK
jgi:hypothetical protein